MGTTTTTTTTLEPTTTTTTTTTLEPTTFQVSNADYDEMNYDILLLPNSYQLTTPGCQEFQKIDDNHFLSSDAECVDHSGEYVMGKYIQDYISNKASSGRDEEAFTFAAITHTCSCDKDPSILGVTTSST